MRTRRTGLFTGETLRQHTRPRHVDPSSALATLGGVTYAWDLASDRLVWGPNAAAVLGLGSDTLPTTGEVFRSLVEPVGGPLRYETVASGLFPYDLRYALRISPGSAILVQDSGRATMDIGGRPGFVRGFLRSDPLSRGQDVLPRNVNDRTAFLCRLQDDIADGLRFSHQVTLIVCGIVEDEIADPQEIIRLIRPMMRRRDHVTVLSANRLALVLTSCSLADAPCATRRLVDLLSTEQRRVRAAAACAPDHALDACRLLWLAEQSLHVDKAVTLHDPEVGLHPVRRPIEPVDMIAALNGRSLDLALQPIRDSHVQDSHGHALVTARLALNHHGKSCILDALPEHGTALLVDGRKLELVADHLADFPETRIVLPIELATLRDPQWLSMLAAHLGARPGIASRLIVALPEPVLMEKAKILGRFDAMKALGIGLAITGFGSGHATYARLKSLPIDLVFIDGAFVQCLKRSTADRLFVRTLIDIAQHLGIAVAAEGVGDDQTAQMLSGWGVDYLCGDAIGAAAVPPSPRLIQTFGLRA